MSSEWAGVLRYLRSQHLYWFEKAGRFSWEANYYARGCLFINSIRYQNPEASPAPTARDRYIEGLLKSKPAEELDLLREAAEAEGFKLPEPPQKPSPRRNDRKPWRQARIASGFCLACPNPRSPHSKNLCEDCIIKHREAVRAWKARQKVNHANVGEQKRAA